MTIVSGLFAMLFGRLLGAKRGAIAAVFGILLYVLMLGGGASILRAALMSGMSLIARQVGRKQQGLNALFLCAALLCVPNPLLLWDVSFQLSFSATLGLILYAEPLQMGFYRLIAGKIPTTLAQKISQWVGEYFLFTLAAQVTTLPVMLTHFERLSLSSLWVNPLILPAQPLVMILGGVSILGALIYQPLGQLLAWMVLPLLLYTIRVVEWFAENTGSVVSLQPIPIFVVIIYYTLLLGLTYYYQSLKKRMVTMGIVGGISILTAATFIVWQLVFTAPDGY
jgi:competence protein ComEC